LVDLLCGWLSECHLLGHLVRPKQQQRRDRQAERLRGLEVDDELELGWLLDWEVTGVRALQDLVDIGRGATIQVGPQRTVRNQPSGTSDVPPTRILLEFVARPPLR